MHLSELAELGGSLAFTTTVFGIKIFANFLPPMPSLLHFCFRIDAGFNGAVDVVIVVIVIWLSISIFCGF